MTDDDAPDIPPALSESEWKHRAFGGPPRVGMALGARLGSVDANQLIITKAGGGTIIIEDVNDLAALVALANEAMRSYDDPRAFMREHVLALREAAETIDTETLAYDVDGITLVPRGESPLRSDSLRELADALESMLPQSDA